MRKINTAQPDLRPALFELIEMGMTQSEIARAIGLSRATINFAIKKDEGKPWMPGYDTGARLVKLLDKRRRKPEPQEATNV